MLNFRTIGDRDGFYNTEVVWLSKAFEEGLLEPLFNREDFVHHLGTLLSKVQMDEPENLNLKLLLGTPFTAMSVKRAFEALIIAVKPQADNYQRLQQVLAPALRQQVIEAIDKQPQITQIAQKVLSWPLETTVQQSTPTNIVLDPCFEGMSKIKAKVKEILENRRLRTVKARTKALQDWFFKDKIGLEEFLHSERDLDKRAALRSVDILSIRETILCELQLKVIATLFQHNIKLKILRQNIASQTIHCEVKNASNMQKLQYAGGEWVVRLPEAANKNLHDEARSKFFGIKRNRLTYYTRILIAVIAAIAFACHCTIAPWLMLLIDPLIKGTFLAHHMHLLSMFSTLFVSIVAGVLLMKTIENNANKKDTDAGDLSDYQHEVASISQDIVPMRKTPIVLFQFSHDDEIVEEQNEEPQAKRSSRNDKRLTRN